MDFNSKLLNEAIADAKAVRETAVQTAISRLKETFEPTVRQLVTRKLAEEGEMDMEDDEMEMEAPAPAPEPTPEPAPAPAPAPAEEEDDFELESVIRELEGEMDDEYMEEGEDMEDDDMMEEGEDMDDMDEAIRELAEEMGIEDEDDMMEMSEEGDELDEIIRELEEELAEEEDEEMMGESRRKSFSSRRRSGGMKESRTISKLRSQLREAYDVIRKQKDTINEVALLNSKLLYLSKITSNNQLSAEKQIKVLEAFDRANSIREVKLVYATIAESIRNSSKKRTKKITEVASRPMRSDRKKILTENNDMVSRWQKLAGIK